MLSIEEPSLERVPVTVRNGTVSSGLADGVSPAVPVHVVSRCSTLRYSIELGGTLDEQFVCAPEGVVRRWMHFIDLPQQSIARTDVDTAGTDTVSLLQYLKVRATLSCFRVMCDVLAISTQAAKKALLPSESACCNERAHMDHRRLLWNMYIKPLNRMFHTCAVAVLASGV